MIWYLIGYGVLVGVSLFFILRLNKKTIKLKNLLKENLSEQTGFYSDSLNLKIKQDDEKGNLYTMLMHVKEIERYKNGYSKIELLKIEISGFDPNHFSHVKDSMTKRFKTIKETKDITWLEREPDIILKRKNKLKRILK